MLELASFARQIAPQKTVLFLGAGASVPSGAPTAEQLCRYLEDSLAKGRRISTDFAELCSLLEQRYSREALVSAVRNRLKNLIPTGGLLALPDFGWHSIYTTNFDTLVELAYLKAEKPIVAIRSNLEYGHLETDDGTPFFKLHGCITEDVIDGAKARMTLTETDFDLSSKYRELLFRRLEFEMTSKDVVVVGYSLRDPDLSSSLKEAARLHQQAGTPGRLLALIYERDEDRAALMEMRGITVAFGGIDELFHELTAAAPRALSITPPSSLTTMLPTNLRSATIDILHAKEQASNPRRLFEGSPASYADIKAGITFKRSAEQLLTDLLLGSDLLSITLVGAAGVGKTTLARRIVYNLASTDFYAWEHRPEFTLRPATWLSVASSLAERNQKGVLLVDDSPSHQREVNNLLEGLLAARLTTTLKLLLVAEKSQWAPRSKSPVIFKHGRIETLSRLDSFEMNNLLNLAERDRIRDLVEPQFAQRSRAARLEYLKQRCHSDMFVALKNIFGSELLDHIILREYAALSEAGLAREQEIYRIVAGLEVAGVKVHRQFLVRLLNISVHDIARVLEVLDGIVEEYDLSADEGLFGWRTRHLVISEILTRYKFYDPAERLALFENAVGHMNPAVPLEARGLKDLCVGSGGIRSLPNPSDRISLYSRLVELMPWERVPRHRLVREYLDEQDLGAANDCLREAFDIVGFDPPLHRYKVLLQIARAEHTEGLLPEDRRALLMQAWDLVIEGIGRQRSDKYAYLVSWDVARAFSNLLQDDSYVDQALIAIRIGYEKLLDPEMETRLRDIENQAFMIRARKKVP